MAIKWQRGGGIDTSKIRWQGGVQQAPATPNERLTQSGLAQFSKGVYESSPLGIPMSKIIDVGQKLGKFNPYEQLVAKPIRGKLHEKMYGEKEPETAEELAAQMERIGTPTARGTKFARAAGGAAPHLAAATPVFRGAGMLAKAAHLPGFIGTVGGGAGYEAISSLVEGKPEETAPRALAGGAGALLFHGLGKAGATLTPKNIPGAERIGSALAGYSAGKLLSPKDEEAALLYGGLGGVLPFKRSEVPQWAKDKFSSRLVNSMIKPRRGEFNFGKNPGLEIARQGLVSKDLPGLLTKVSKRGVDVMSKIDTIIADASKRAGFSDYSDALRPLAAATAKALRSPFSNKTVINKLHEVVLDLQGWGPDPRTGKIVRYRQVDFKRLNAQEALEIKRQMGKLADWATEDYVAKKIVNNALRRSYHTMGSNLNRHVAKVGHGNLRGLMMSEANLISAEQAIRNRITAIEKTDLLAGSRLGVIFGSLIGMPLGNVPGALQGAILGGAVEKAMGSPIVRTKVAAWLQGQPLGAKAAFFRQFPQLQPILQKAGVYIKNIKPGMTIEDVSGKDFGVKKKPVEKEIIPSVNLLRKYSQEHGIAIEDMQPYHIREAWLAVPGAEKPKLDFHHDVATKGWASRLREEILYAPQHKWDVNQFQHYISQRTSAIERQHYKLDEFLRGKESVTAQELIGHMDSVGVPNIITKKYSTPTSEKLTPTEIQKTQDKAVAISMRNAWIPYAKWSVADRRLFNSYISKVEEAGVRLANLKDPRWKQYAKKVFPSIKDSYSEDLILAPDRPVAEHEQYVEKAKQHLFPEKARQGLTLEETEAKEVVDLAEEMFTHDRKRAFYTGGHWNDYNTLVSLRSFITKKGNEKIYKQFETQSDWIEHAVKRGEPDFIKLSLMRRKSDYDSNELRSLKDDLKTMWNHYYPENAVEAYFNNRLELFKAWKIFGKNPDVPAADKKFFKDAIIRSCQLWRQIKTDDPVIENLEHATYSSPLLKHWIELGIKRGLYEASVKGATRYVGGSPEEQIMSWGTDGFSWRHVLTENGMRIKMKMRNVLTEDPIDVAMPDFNSMRISAAGEGSGWETYEGINSVRAMLPANLKHKAVMLNKRIKLEKEGIWMPRAEFYQKIYGEMQQHAMKKVLGQLIHRMKLRGYAVPEKTMTVEPYEMEARLEGLQVPTKRLSESPSIRLTEQMRKFIIKNGMYLLTVPMMGAAAALKDEEQAQ